MNSFFETLKQLGPARLSIMGSVILGLILFFVFVSVRITVPEMKLLYADLSPLDSGAVATKLQENNINFDISQDGTKIVVPDDQVSRARMILAAAGLPNGGSLGYELFDKQSGFGTTTFVQNVNQMRALEGELARTITSLDVVRSARVHLVLPQRELFSRDKRQASASVFLGIFPGAQIEREQIASIQSLVASAVPDLKVANVSIIDSNGNLLAKGGETGASLLSMRAEEMRRNYETRLTSKIEDQIGRIVGYGKVRATVTAEVNFDRISTNEELFDPEGQVLRSSQVTEENSLERQAAAGGNVSIDNNLPGVGSDLLGGNAEPSAENLRLEEVNNYEISKTIRSTVRETGEIKRLSIAVLVDGLYNKNEEGMEIYTPRSQEDLDQITALVRSAAGFDEDRGDTIEVVNLQFAKVDTDEEAIDSRMLLGFDKSKLLDFAEILTILIMILLVIVLVLQPMVNKLLASVERTPEEDLEADLLAAAPMSPALAAPMDEEESGVEESLINIDGVEGKVKASTIKRVEEIIENYPKEAISVIRSWMAQEG